MACFWGSLLCVLCNTSRQGVNRLKRGRKPSPWPTEALRGLPASSQNWASLAQKPPSYVFSYLLCSLAPYLDLILLTGILNGLEDSPGAAASHFQPSHVAPIPLLDQDSCFESWGTRTEPICWAALAAAEVPATAPSPPLNIEEEPCLFRGKFPGIVFSCLRAKKIHFFLQEVNLTLPDQRPLKHF